MNGIVLGTGRLLDGLSKGFKKCMFLVQQVFLVSSSDFGQKMMFPKRCVLCRGRNYKTVGASVTTGRLLDWPDKGFQNVHMRSSRIQMIEDCIVNERKANGVRKELIKNIV